MSDVIVVATHNKGKMKEFEKLAERLGLSFVTRDEAGVPHEFDVVEDGETFEENSYKKAYEIMMLCGKPTLSDDSGLVVDALNGEPGVLSARYGGVDGDDMRNKEKLLREMKDVPAADRTAHFETVITLIYPETDEETGEIRPGKTIRAKGTCEGSITTEMRGSLGFGYDPVFVPSDEELSAVGALQYSGRTFGEMGVDFKNQLSHRSKALKELEKKLKD